MPKYCYSDVKGILSSAIKIHNENRVFIENHQCYYRKENASQEIEYKYNIYGNADPWVMINDLYYEIQQKRIKNFIFEYKDDFQKWDYMNYMFKINGNDDQKGYISFIPQTNGKCLIKRKIFGNDQLSRKEIHYRNVDVNIPFSKYIENEFKVDYIEFPPFRRVRYDINIECVEYGNVHGIFFDRIIVPGYRKKLMQCEIEYLRTRSLFNNSAYYDELSILNKYMESFFLRYNISHTKTFYSKLSFMEELCGVKR